MQSLAIARATPAIEGRALGKSAGIGTHHLPQIYLRDHYSGAPLFMPPLGILTPQNIIVRQLHSWSRLLTSHALLEFVLSQFHLRVNVSYCPLATNQQRQTLEVCSYGSIQQTLVVLNRV